MGNTNVREGSRSQQVDDSGPTLFQSKNSGYPSRVEEYENQKIFAHSTESDSRYINVVPENVQGRKIPSVLKWDGGGHYVYVSFDEGATKIPMAKSENNFYTIVNLEEGTHNYKFLVDGQWKCDPKEPKDPTDTYNTLCVKNSDFEVFEALAVDSENANENSKSILSGSPPGTYTQDIPGKTSSNSAPPSLPPQLLQVILNTETPLQNEPSMLPEPNHVMLNHLYALSIKDGVIVMSGTHRYRKKYVTTLLYKPT